MAAPYHKIESRVEQAVLTLLRTLNLDGVQLFPGHNNEGSLIHDPETGEVIGAYQGLQVPYILVICDGAKQEVDGVRDGVMVADVRVEVWTHKHDEPGPAHADRTGLVRDALMTNTLEADLSAAATDLQIFLVPSQDFTTSTEGIHFVSTVTLQIICSPFDAV